VATITYTDTDGNESEPATASLSVALYRDKSKSLKTPYMNKQSKDLHYFFHLFGLGSQVKT
jgi:hypothetical protein